MSESPRIHEMRNIAHVFGWWLRRDGAYWSLTWAPLGMAVVIIRERGFCRLLWHLRELPSRRRWAKQHAIELEVELSRLRLGASAEREEMLRLLYGAYVSLLDDGWPPSYLGQVEARECIAGFLRERGRIDA